MTSRQINFRCPDEVADVLEAAAARANQSLTGWLIAVGLTAAGKTELLTQLERVAPAKKRTRKKR
jgi:uncharacterized protein (DUF1778 family)